MKLKMIKIKQLNDEIKNIDCRMKIINDELDEIKKSNDTIISYIQKMLN